MRNRWSMMLCVALVACVAGSVSAADKRKRDEGKLVDLGSRKVDFKADHDVIEVGKHEGAFTAIRLRIENGDVELMKVKIVFADGETYEPDTRVVFKEGDRTKDIDLPGKARVIKRVEFIARSEHKRDPATILLQGREAK